VALLHALNDVGPHSLRLAELVLAPRIQSRIHQTRTADGFSLSVLFSCALIYSHFRVLAFLAAATSALCKSCGLEEHSLEGIRLCGLSPTWTPRVNRGGWERLSAAARRLARLGVFSRTRSASDRYKSRSLKAGSPSRLAFHGFPWLGKPKITLH